MEHTLSVWFVAALGCFAMRTTQVLPTTTFDSVNLEILHSSATGTATASSGLACDKLTRTTGASASLQLLANPSKGLSLVCGPMVRSPATGTTTAARPTPRGDQRPSESPLLVWQDNPSYVTDDWDANGSDDLGVSRKRLKWEFHNGTAANFDFGNPHDIPLTWQAAEWTPGELHS